MLYLMLMCTVSVHLYTWYVTLAIKNLHFIFHGICGVVQKLDGIKNRYHGLTKLLS